MTRSRRIRIGAETFLLVRRRDVIELRDREAARRFIARSIGDGHDVSQLRRIVEEQDAEIALTDGDVLARVEALLASGQLVAVRVREAMPALDRPTIRPLVEPRGLDGPGRGPTGPFDPPTVDEILFDYEVRLVDEIGEPIAGVALTMDVGAGRYACTTNADGVASVQAPQVDAARVEVADVPALREDLRPRWEKPRTGEWLNEQVDHTYVECAEPMAAAFAKPQIRETIVVQPWVVRARLLELLFDTNKAFLLPGALAKAWLGDYVGQRRLLFKLLTKFTVGWELHGICAMGVRVTLAVATPDSILRVRFVARRDGEEVFDDLVFRDSMLPERLPGVIVARPESTLRDGEPPYLAATVTLKWHPDEPDEEVVFTLRADGVDQPDKHHSSLERA